MQNNVIPVHMKFLNEILTNVSFLFYGPYLLLKSQFLKGYKTPLKEFKRPIGKTTIELSKYYDLDMAKKLTKQLGVTFNDLIMMLISKSMSKVCINNGYNGVINFNSLIAIGRAALPNDIKELQVGNNSTGVFFQLPAVKNIIEESNTVSQVLKKQLKNVGLANAVVKLADFVYEILPLELNLKLAKTFTNNIDFTCSNIPGPNKQVCYDGCKVYSMFPLPSASKINVFIPIVSYNGRYLIIVSTNESIDFEKKIFLEFLDIELNNLISQLKLN
jgi:nitrogen fixation protein FixH